MHRTPLLLADAVINLLLGLVLIAFPRPLVELLGIPPSDSAFYPSILGAVFIGIAVALTLEHYRKPSGIIGLGLGGAVAINLCGGIVLVAWLLFGGLEVPWRGYVLLWALAVLLLFISAEEVVTHRRRTVEK